MKEIKEFQKQNGNVTYTTKELLGALHVKIGRIEERLRKGGNKIATNRANIEANEKSISNIFKYGLVVLGAIGSVFAWIINKINGG